MWTTVLSDGTWERKREKRIIIECWLSFLTCLSCRMPWGWWPASTPSRVYRANAGHQETKKELSHEQNYHFYNITQIEQSHKMCLLFLSQSNRNQYTKYTLEFNYLKTKWTITLKIYFHHHSLLKQMESSKT